MAEGFVPFTAEQLKTSEGVAELNRVLQLLIDNVYGNTENIRHFVVKGTPESQISAGIGSTATRRDGGASTTFYVKESGTASTGWVAK